MTKGQMDSHYREREGEEEGEKKTNETKKGQLIKGAFIRLPFIL